MAATTGAMRPFPGQCGSGGFIRAPRGDVAHGTGGVSDTGLGRAPLQWHGTQSIWTEPPERGG